MIHEKTDLDICLKDGVFYGGNLYFGIYLFYCVFILSFKSWPFCERHWLFGLNQRFVLF